MAYFKFHTSKRARNGRLFEKNIYVRANSLSEAQISINSICSFDYSNSKSVPVVQIFDEDEYIAGALADSFSAKTDERRARFPEKVAATVLDEMMHGNTPSGKYRKQLITFYKRFAKEKNRAELVVEFDEWAEGVIENARRHKIVDEINEAVNKQA